MPDELTENGLTLSTASEIRADLVQSYQGIYGDDIVLDSNTADGQLIDIYTQAAIDIREVIREVYNTIDPDYCRGTIQDIRYRINHLVRSGGTYTIVPITMVINATVTLQGLDSNYNDPNATAFGFSDDSGQKYYLIDSTTLTAGTYTKLFRAATLGEVHPIIGTITTPITIVKGVVSGINNSAPTSIGVDQETDEAFALRRQRSPEYRGQNTIDAMRAQLLALDGVSDAYVYQNPESTTDSDGIPPHYIWVIAEGGANEDIADVIYANSGGAGCKGSVVIDVPTTSGQTFKARFDRPTAVPLYIRFDCQETVAKTIFNFDEIKQYIADNLVYVINEFAETSKITEVARTAISSTTGSGVPTNVEISTDGTNWVDYIPSGGKGNIFTVDTTRIIINEVEI